MVSTALTLLRGLSLVAGGALAALTIGCGGGGSSGASSAKEPRDARSAPTASPFATIPPAIPAVDIARQLGLATSTPTVASNVHVVGAGDTLSVIATRAGISVEDLMKANSITDPQSLKLGQALTIPTPPPRTAIAGSVTPTSTATRGRTPSISANGPVTTGSATATRPGGSPTAGTRTPGGSVTATVAGGGPTVYKVRPGDTACGIAGQFGVPLTAIARENNLTEAQLAALRIDMELKIPAQKGPPGC